MNLTHLSDDEVISGVLDIIIDLTDWDPEAIWPDYALEADLKMSESELAQFFVQLQQRFLPNQRLDVSVWRKMTLREIVDSVRRHIVAAAA